MIVGHASENEHLSLNHSKSAVSRVVYFSCFDVHRVLCQSIAGEDIRIRQGPGGKNNNIDVALKRTQIENSQYVNITLNKKIDPNSLILRHTDYYELANVGARTKILTLLLVLIKFLKNKGFLFNNISVHKNNVCDNEIMIKIRSLIFLFLEGITIKTIKNITISIFTDVSVVVQAAKQSVSSVLHKFI